MSNLRLQEEKIIFEARVSTEYPHDSAAAESVRMSWLAEWMKLRGLCPAGYEVIERVFIPPEETHFRNHDLIYTVRCTS